MPAVEWDAEDLTDGWIPVALHVVDPLGDDAEVEEFVGVDVVEKTVRGTPLVREKSMAT